MWASGWRLQLGSYWEVDLPSVFSVSPKWKCSQKQTPNWSVFYRSLSVTLEQIHIPIMSVRVEMTMSFSPLWCLSHLAPHEQVSCPESSWMFTLPLSDRVCLQKNVEAHGGGWKGDFVCLTISLKWLHFDLSLISCGLVKAKPIGKGWGHRVWRGFLPALWLSSEVVCQRPGKCVCVCPCVRVSVSVCVHMLWPTNVFGVSSPHM